MVSHKVTESARALEQHGAEEVRRMRWVQACTAALAKLPAAARQSADAAAKSAAWKVAVAAHLKATTDVSNGSPRDSHRSLPHCLAIGVTEREALPHKDCYR